jgi:hypothetical protein
MGEQIHEGQELTEVVTVLAQSRLRRWVACNESALEIPRRKAFLSRSANGGLELTPDILSLLVSYAAHGGPLNTARLEQALTQTRPKKFGCKLASIAVLANNSKLSVVSKLKAGHLKYRIHKYILYTE